MKNDKKYYKERLSFARQQRLNALKIAFKMIDEFAKCSLNPDLYAKYIEVKKDLIKNYSKE